MKTSELTGAALDWAVAKCEGVDIDKYFGAWVPDPREPHFNKQFQPSTDWAQGGPIIEQEKYCSPTWNELWKQWHCFHPRNSALGILGPTPLLAAMRTYVASKLGDDVDIPEELK